MHIQSDRSAAYLRLQSQAIAHHPMDSGSTSTTTRFPTLILRDVDSYLLDHPGITQSQVIKTAVALYMESYFFPQQCQIITDQSQPTTIAAIAA